jgi:GT2 family glycosyltransferase
MPTAASSTRRRACSATTPGCAAGIWPGRTSPNCSGCHFSLFRDDVERVNGFDERFVGWGYEDDDFARRLYKAGVEPRSVIEDARALHLWHPSLAPQELKRHRDRPNRAYFRRWRVPAYCANGLTPPGAP